MGKVGLKFGQKEHLTKLKDGEVFFNSINKYREDGTNYRGDYLRF